MTRWSDYCVTYCVTDPVERLLCDLVCTDPVEKKRRIVPMQQAMMKLPENSSRRYTSPV